MMVFVGVVMVATLIFIFLWSFPCIRKAVADLDARVKYTITREYEAEENQLWVGLDDFRFYIYEIIENDYLIWCTNTNGFSTIALETRSSWNIKKERYKLHLVGII
jgi:hypothetical protein